jgi:hypothetical protein
MKVALALIVGLLLAAGRADAQVDFSGTWALDRDISGDPSKATFEPPREQTRRNTGLTGGFGGFGRGGFGGRNGGMQRGGGSNDGRNGGAGTALSDEERAKLRELALYVKGLTSMVIEHTDHSTFTVTDAPGRARLFPTDGARTPQALATTTVDSVTKWDGPHMVTVYTIGTSHELVFTYILVPATKQMALRIRLDDSGRPRADVPELRLVYKLAAPTHSSPGPRH